MQQFGYTQTILRHPVIYVPPALTRRQIDDMFADFESHLIPEEAHSILVVNNWSYVDVSETSPEDGGIDGRGNKGGIEGRCEIVRYTQ